jgi:hypothetical protein
MGVMPSTGTATTVASSDVNPSTVLSASALARQAGLDISETLVIGDLDDILNGRLPLAATMPTTMGRMDWPETMALTPPNARRKIERIEEFDSGLFVSAVQRVSASFDDRNMFEALFADATNTRRNQRHYQVAIRTVWGHQLRMEETAAQNTRGNTRMTRQQRNQEAAEKRAARAASKT